MVLNPNWGWLISHMEKFKVPPPLWSGRKSMSGHRTHIFVLPRPMLLAVSASWLSSGEKWWASLERNMYAGGGMVLKHDLKAKCWPSLPVFLIEGKWWLDCFILDIKPCLWVQAIPNVLIRILNPFSYRRHNHISNLIYKQEWMRRFSQPFCCLSTWPAFLRPLETCIFPRIFII